MESWVRLGGKEGDTNHAISEKVWYWKGNLVLEGRDLTNCAKRNWRLKTKQKNLGFNFKLICSSTLLLSQLCLQSSVFCSSFSVAFAYCHKYSRRSFKRHCLHRGTNSVSIITLYLRMALMDPLKRSSLPVNETEAPKLAIQTNPY